MRVGNTPCAQAVGLMPHSHQPEPAEVYLDLQVSFAGGQASLQSTFSLVLCVAVGDLTYKLMSSLDR